MEAEFSCSLIKYDSSVVWWWCWGGGGGGLYSSYAAELWLESCVKVCYLFVCRFVIFHDSACRSITELLIRLNCTGGHQLRLGSRPHTPFPLYGTNSTLSGFWGLMPPLLQYSRYSKVLLSGNTSLARPAASLLFPPNNPIYKST